MAGIGRAKVLREKRASPKRFISADGSIDYVVEIQCILSQLLLIFLAGY